jgi:hypothetical protein
MADRVVLRNEAQKGVEAGDEERAARGEAT